MKRWCILKLAHVVLACAALGCTSVLAHEAVPMAYVPASAKVSVCCGACAERVSADWRRYPPIPRHCPKCKVELPQLPWRVVHEGPWDHVHHPQLRPEQLVRPKWDR